MKKFEEQIKDLIHRMQNDIDEGKLDLPPEMEECLVYLKKQEYNLFLKQNELKFTPQVSMIWFQDYDYSPLLAHMLSEYLSTVYNVPASWFSLVPYSLGFTNEDDIVFSLTNTEILYGNGDYDVPYTCAFNEAKMLGLIDKNEKAKYETPNSIIEALELCEILEMQQDISGSHAFTLA